VKIEERSLVGAAKAAAPLSGDDNENRGNGNSNGKMATVAATAKSNGCPANAGRYRWSGGFGWRAGFGVGGAEWMRSFAALPSFIGASRMTTWRWAIHD